MYDKAHNKSFCTGLTAVTEARKNIVFMLENVIIFFIGDYMIYCGSFLSDADTK